jgi:hypothetical protein
MPGEAWHCLRCHICHAQVVSSRKLALHVRGQGCCEKRPNLSDDEVRGSITACGMLHSVNGSRVNMPTGQPDMAGAGGRHPEIRRQCLGM